MYIPGDFIAHGDDGAIYECWDMPYCQTGPETATGAYGWGKTPFFTSGL